MSPETSTQQIIKVIASAVESGKVDSYMKHAFSRLKDESGFDPTTQMVPFLARVTSAGVELPHVLSKIENIYAIHSPWSEIPDYVNNKVVVSIELSR